MNETRNHRLEQAMRDAGFSQKSLARAVRSTALRHGARVGTDHTSVARWLSGMRPRQKTPLFVAEAISQRLGRTLSPIDLGLADGPAVSHQLGLVFNDDADDATSTLVSLWRADLDELPTIVDSRVESAAWNESSLRWLTGARGRLVERATSPRVGQSDIDAIKDTVEHFAQLDNKHGGGRGRRSLLRFLADDVAPLLGGQFGDSTRKQLFSAVAEANLLAAWMSYDSGLHGLAQRHFIQALRLAETAGDRQLGASILSAMSHQATFLGRFREAFSLARAGLAGLGGAGTATLRAQFHAMEARALAGQRDTRACDLALADAVREFDHRDPDADPEWIRYFDLPELTAEIVHCERDLGRATRAVVSPVSALGHDGDTFARSDFFASLALAEAHVAAGDPEQGCIVATQALLAGSDLRSERCKAYVASLRRTLQPFADLPGVRDRLEELGQHQAWKWMAA